MAASTTPQDTADCVVAGGPWATMRVQPHETKLRCSYAVQAGAPGDSPIGLTPSWVTGLIAPATSWFFLVATCTNTEYFQASWDTRLRSKDGK